MDKLERAEQMAKAIAKYLRKHKVICPLDKQLMENEGWLEKYLREAILEFEKVK